MNKKIELFLAGFFIVVLFVFVYSLQKGETRFQIEEKTSLFYKYSAETTDLVLYQGQKFHEIPQIQEEKNLIFATNGGMYHQDFSPVGLYRENFKEITPVNTKEGDGNFFLQPNGVFFIDRDTAGVLTTENYISLKIEPQFATQSGPMLVIDGKINPLFSEDSHNKQIRSGVCVKDSKALFLLSQEKDTFYALAEAFLEKGCTEALYLDGYVSDFYKEGKEYFPETDYSYGVFIAEYK